MTSTIESQQFRSGLLDTLVEAVARAVSASAVFVTAEHKTTRATLIAEFPALAASRACESSIPAFGDDSPYPRMWMDELLMAVPVRSAHGVTGWAVAVGWDRRHQTETERLMALLAKCAGVLLDASVDPDKSDNGHRRWQDAARDGYWEWDLESGALHLSRRALALLDHHGTDRPSSPDIWLDRVLQDDRAVLVSALLTAMAERNEPVDCDHRVVRRDGSQRWLSARALLEYDDVGRPIRLVGWLCDVTRTRHIETELRNAHALADVGRLAAGAAHDFNNLLTVIRGHTELALGAVAPDSAVRENLELIKHAAAGATALTRQLLAARRRRETEPTLINLSDAVRSAERTLRLLAGKNIELALRLTPGRTRVRMDAGNVERILINLVVNGRDAMPGGGVLEIATAHVTLRATSDPERPLLLKAGPYVTLTVKDTGTGMDDATRASIFEPFFTTKPPGQGTGLGLWIVRDVVERCGGAIDVRTTPGAGTAFVVYIPEVTDLGDQ